MKKKSLLILWLVAMVSSLFYVSWQIQQGALQAYDRYQSTTTTSEPVEAVTDFYHYVNQEWLAQTEIPSYAPMYGVTDEMDMAVHSNLWDDLQELVVGEKRSDLLGMSEMINFYWVAFDFERREADGVEPLKPYLKQLEDLSSLEDLSKKAKDLTLAGMPMPFYLGLGVNDQDTSRQMLELYAPKLILNDVAYYEDEDEMAELLSVYKASASALLVKMGYSKQEAQKLVQQAIAFDQAMVPYRLTSEEASNVTNLINPRQPEEVATYSKVINLAELAADLVNQDTGAINVGDLAYFEHLDDLLTPEAFPQIKAWMLVQLAVGAAPYLDDDSRLLAGQLDLALTGAEELSRPEEAAYGELLEYFEPVLSTYYGQRHFGKQAKQDVTEMIDTIVAVYKDRLKTNTWLSEKTKLKAIEKLERMTYFVGYPESVDPDVALYQVDSEASFLDNIWQMDEALIKAEFERFGQAVDRNKWLVPSYEVNAFYNPSNNSIILPAAILSEPLFGSNRTPAQNYGAIGAVIGHEITHAFDSNGAHFDASGNMTEWWTEADRVAFEEKIQAMVAHFDGAPSYGGQVNGRLTVTENTADAGGLSSALEALKRVDSDPDLKQFFESYAMSWRNQVRPEFAKVLLLDEHAPDELRVNRQVNLLDDFYQVYDVKEGDAMYLPKEERLNIW